MKRLLTFTISLFTCCILAVMPAYAEQIKAKDPSEASKTQAELNGYSEEQWSALKDNKLEYGEIKDIIHNFNPSISEYWDSYDDSLRSMEYSVDILREAKKDAQDTYAGSMYDPAMSYQDRLDLMTSVMASQKVFTQFNETYKNFKKGGSAKRQLTNVEDQLTNAVQQMMIGYKTIEANVKILGKLVELNEASVKAYTDMKARGMATDTDVLKAQADLISARSNLASLEAARKQLYSQLITMCGWNADDKVLIGEVPDTDQSVIDAMDPEKDLTKAAGNNSTLISLRSEGRNKNAGALKAQDDYYTSMEDNLRIKLDTLYAAVLGAQYAYEGAKAGYEGAKIRKEAMQKQSESGMLSEAQYIGSQIQVLQKEAALETARNNLRQAVEEYEWAVKGFCSLN